MNTTPTLPDLETLSPAQLKVLRILARAPNTSEQLSGNGMAPIVAAAKALVRKGVIGSGGGSSYFLLDHARVYAMEYLLRWRTERAAEKAITAQESAHARRLPKIRSIKLYPIDPTFPSPDRLTQAHRTVLASLYWQPRMRMSIHDPVLLQAAQALQRRGILGQGLDNTYFVKKAAQAHASNVFEFCMQKCFKGGVECVS